ncbi:MAG: helix-turn-helix transcriptional regulator [Thermodesulfobacteriota bacterium]|nr:helix-turn-helix transcriptional regulator [Thermodesulfobacteriota bacterium]
MLEPMKKPNTTDDVNLSFRISAKQADKAKKALISIGAEELKESIYWEDIFPDFGPSVALRGSRKRECMTQKGLADQIGVKQVHISQMENEKRPIGKAMAKRLANVLNVDYRIFL